MSRAAYLSSGVDLVSGEPVTEIMKRQSVVEWMCRLGDEDCLRDVNAQLAAHSEWVAPDLQYTVYCSGMRSGNADDFDYLYAKYTSGNVDSAQSSRLLTALGCSLDEEILERSENFTKKIVTCPKTTLLKVP